jgi:hypothetical protein
MLAQDLNNMEVIVSKNFAGGSGAELILFPLMQVRILTGSTVTRIDSHVIMRSLPK